MFSNRKIRKIFTVLVAVLMMGIAIGLVLGSVLGFVFLITARAIEKEPVIIMQNDPSVIAIRAIFFGVIALGAIVYEKETQSKYAGIIGTLLATIGFAVSIFIS